MTNSPRPSHVRWVVLALICLVGFVPIAKGEFVLPSKLAGENAGSGMTPMIPTGMRAVSVRVNEVIGVTGFVLPGTRVDVLLTGNPSGWK